MSLKRVRIEQNIKNIFTFIFMFGILITFLLLMFASILGYTTDDWYNYVDLDGNTGVADYCSHERGVLWCRDDYKRITVKEYSLKRN